MGSDWLIRPMRPEDVPVAERLSAEAFLEVDRAVRPRSMPEPELRPATRAQTWGRRTTHFLATDPGGCWVAEDDGGMLGFATSINRELMWILATYAVRPGLQGRGIGRQLLDAALHHGRGSLRGMLSSSSDPKAVRRYRLAGFTLHPQMYLRGRVDRSAIPVIEHVREGADGDRDLMDSVDRHTRGAAHGADHEILMADNRLIVTETSTGTGYAYLAPAGGVSLLAATDRRAATRLLWTAIADGPENFSTFHITAANEWAIDVGVAARLEVHQEGYLALRHLAPPTPYLHHGSVL